MENNNSPENTDDRSKQQEINQFNQYYLNNVKDSINRKNTSIEVVRNLSIKNIDWIRKYQIHLDTLSLLILAPIVPLVSQYPDIFAMRKITFIGMILLLTQMILSIVYLNKIISAENNGLSDKLEFIKMSSKKETDLLLKNKERKILPEVTEETRRYMIYEFAELETKLLEVKESIFFQKVSDVCTWLFIIGLLLIVISFFDISFIIN
ncbi:MAG: hypothetical protein WC570_00840 [Patescibacteria group bacterium]